MTENAAATGTALAALVLQTQILHTLLQSGMVPKPAMLAMIDAAILTVEEMPRDGAISSEAIGFARMRLLEVQSMIEGAAPTGQR